MMLCPTCGKESSNLRICGFCQTPYPTDGSGHGGSSRDKRAARQSRSSHAISPSGLIDTLRDLVERQSRAKPWGAIGLLAVLIGVYLLMGREPDIPVGVVIPNLIAAPMSAVEATNTLNSVNGTAPVEVRDGEVFVRVGKATFPQRRPGQLAFAQQYARADEIVQGRKRAISFLDPDGNRFARADPETGVSMTR